MTNTYDIATLRNVEVWNPADNSLRINGGSQWAHSTSIRTGKKAGRVVISGVDLKSNGDAALIVDGCESLTVTSCGLGKSAADWPTVPAAKLRSGKSVLINACTFDANGPGVVISDSMDYFSITNNVFQPSPFEKIKDNSPASANKIIENNLMKTVQNKQ